MTRKELLDLYFMDARHKLVDLAAFLDRLERSPGEDDFRLTAFREALAALSGPAPGKAEEVLLVFSDRTGDPVESAPVRSACGAPPPRS